MTAPFRRFIGGLRALVYRSRAERELDEELAAYLEAAATDRMSAGLDREEAMRAVRAETGSPEAVKEYVRDAGWESLVSTIGQDVRYAIRTLRRTPGFTTAAVLTLALGIGANTTIFSAADAVLLRPLPYPDPDRLVQVWETLPDGEPNEVSGGAFQDWRAHARGFDALALAGHVTANLRDAGEPERLTGLEVTHEFLDVFGVALLRGRGFTAGHEHAGAANHVVILTEELWRSRFGSDESIVGRRVILDDMPRTVIGILPARAWTHRNVQFLVPAVLDPSNPGRSGRASHWAYVYGRMSPGRSVPQVEDDLRRVKAALDAEYPEYKRQWGVHVVPLHQMLAGDRRPVLMLVGAVALVLLIACANVASLLLARATVREREIALRAALGASGARIVRQMLTESLVLALIGGTAGFVLSTWGIRLLAHWTADILPLAMTPRLDGRVLAAAVAIACGTGVLFGILPAWKARRPDVNETLRSGGKGTTMGRRSRAHGALIVAEVALTVVLLTSAGLLLHSLVRTAAVDPGFEPGGALTFELSLPDWPYPTDESRLAFTRAALERLESIPGVVAAASSAGSPFGFGDFGEYFSRTDRPETRFDRLGRINFVSGHYLEALGARLIRGRPLTGVDNRADAARVVLVNEEVVRVLFPDEDPIGRRVTVRGDSWEIVGVVENMRLRALEEPPPLYAFAAQAFFPARMSIIVRTARDPRSMTGAIREGIAELDAGLPLANLRTLEEALADSLAPRRVLLALIAGFAVAALALACIGLYGVMAYTVATRRQELCVRMAIGAERRDVIGLILRDGIRLTSLGVIAGIAGALAASQLLSGQLFEVRGHDPLAFGGTVAIVVVVSIVACWLPARQATRLNPMTALRID